MEVEMQSETPSSSATTDGSQLESYKAHFLQILLAHGMANAEEVKKILNHVCQNHEIDEATIDLGQLVGELNENLKQHISLWQIVKKRDEWSGKAHYIVVNTDVDGSVVKHVVGCTVNELYFISELVKQIVRSDSGTVTTTMAVNIGPTLRDSAKLTCTKAELLLERLQNANWISMSDSGIVSLTCRSIAHLRAFIADELGDVPKCSACNDICIRGIRCEECGDKFHKYCMRQMPAQKCPCRKENDASSSPGE